MRDSLLPLSNLPFQMEPNISGGTVFFTRLDQILVSLYGCNIQAVNPVRSVLSTTHHPGRKCCSEQNHRATEYDVDGDQLIQT